MTADPGKSVAEEFLRALARDLVEEISAGRALEMAQELTEDDVVELASFNIRPFQRTVTTKSGQRITEQVRAHTATRGGVGAIAPQTQAPSGGGPGLEHPGDFGRGAAHFIAGEPGHMARGNISEAAWKANQWGKGVHKLHAAIGKTHDVVRPKDQNRKAWGPDSPSAAFLRSHEFSGEEGSVHPHLQAAQHHLMAVQETDNPNQRGEHVGNAYHELAEAHRKASEVVVKHARTAEQRKGVSDVASQIRKHLEELDKLTGSSGGTTKQLAAEAPSFNNKRAEGLDKLSSSLKKTYDSVFGARSADAKGERKPHTAIQELWNQHGFKAAGSLYGAQLALGHAQGGSHEELAKAYHQLAEAHRVGVEEVLPRAHHAGPEVKDQARKHLETIQSHMEALDKLAGTSPDMTRRLLGTSAQHEERASAVRDEARRAMEDAVARGDAEAASALVLSPQGSLLDWKYAAEGISRAADAGRQREATGLPAPPMPAPPSGAAAVYPGMGQHLLKPAGGSISGHENTGRAMPMQGMQQPLQSPEAAALEQANKKLGAFAKREGQRRDQDLKDHLAALQAMEAERQGVAAPGEYQPLSDEEFHSHVAQLESKIEEALRAGVATDQQFSLDGQGQVWSPERAQLHAEILHDFFDKQVDVPSQRHALFLGGLPGAGKSSLLRDHPEIDLSNYAVLNPDHFKEELAKRGAVPEVEGLSPMERAALVHEESAYLTDLAAEELQRRGKNVAWDVTMKNHSITSDRVSDLKDHRGYTVHGVLL